MTVSVPVIARTPAGPTRVGTVVLVRGIQTNHGEFYAVTRRGLLNMTDGFHFDPTVVTVSLTEARRHGYPHAEGCVRERLVVRKRTSVKTGKKAVRYA
jgi:hypothetical protein